MRDDNGRLLEFQGVVAGWRVLLICSFHGCAWLKREVYKASEVGVDGVVIRLDKRGFGGLRVRVCMSGFYLRYW